MNFDATDIRSPKPKRRELGKLVPAVLISLAIHGGLLAVIMNSEVGGQAAVERQVVAVRFIPQNPLADLVDPSSVDLPPDEPSTAEPSTIAPTAIESSTLESQVVETVDVLSESSKPQLEQAEPDAQENVLPDNDKAKIAEAETSVPGANETEDVPASIAAPSVLAVQKSLRDLQDNSVSKFYAYDCNPLEEEIGLKDCRPQFDTLKESGYQPVQRSLTYRTLNPTRSLSRSERSLDVVSSQSEALTARVSNLNIPEGLGEYITQELEAGISHNADLGNRTVEHMLKSTDKSAAGAMARELLSDPWVVKKTKQQRQRRVRLPN